MTYIDTIVLLVDGIENIPTPTLARSDACVRHWHCVRLALITHRFALHTISSRPILATHRVSAASRWARMSVCAFVHSFSTADLIATHTHTLWLQGILVEYHKIANRSLFEWMESRQACDIIWYCHLCFDGFASGSEVNEAWNCKWKLHEKQSRCAGCPCLRNAMPLFYFSLFPIPNKSNQLQNSKCRRSVVSADWWTPQKSIRHTRRIHNSISLDKMKKKWVANAADAKCFEN